MEPLDAVGAVEETAAAAPTAEAGGEAEGGRPAAACFGRLDEEALGADGSSQEPTPLALTEPCTLQFRRCVA